ncbi:phosphatidylinositol 4-kinase gamma 8-like [Tasmannia lanceolata]|uniref:phosphatidylinositol 4-kinase gamma 8-like n=1 Tax=Tasmannia lanceolata TaxID=3420 RepID=UPI0040634FB1
MKLSQMAVAIDHHHGGFKPLVRTQIYKLRSFAHPDSTMLELDQRTNKLARSLKTLTTSSSSFHRSVSTPCFSASTKKRDEEESNNKVEIMAGSGAPGIRAVVVESTIAMASGVDPVSASGGLGGAYFLRTRSGQSIAVMKPIEDQEPLDPKGFGGRILGQPSVLAGVREVAAYLLDHGAFAGVPPTTLVRISHANHCSAGSKIASLQRFVAHDYDAGDLGPSSFSVASVHRIGILDVRLLNIDRHAGNILVKKHGRGGDDGSNSTVVGADLVPIDHGLCLPELLEDPYFEWLHWPQASVPFSDAELEYITELNPSRDADLLRKELPLLTESSIRVLVLCTTFLQRAASAVLCLADIGDMMTREFRGTEEELSVLETLCMRAKATMMIITFDEGQEKNGEIEHFQFDIECEEDDICIEEDQVGNVLDLPRLFQSHPRMGKPPKVPLCKLQIPREALSPLLEEDGDDDTDENDTEEDKPMAGILTKSVSISAIKHNPECGGISFKGMSEKEWEVFLERFELLLPEAFESRKSMGLKQRLGTSCKF